MEIFGPNGKSPITFWRNVNFCVNILKICRATKQTIAIVVTKYVNDCANNS